MAFQRSPAFGSTSEEGRTHPDTHHQYRPFTQEISAPQPSVRLSQRVNQRVKVTRHVAFGDQSCPLTSLRLHQAA